MIGLGFNKFSREILLQDYPVGSKVRVLADITRDNIAAGEEGTVLEINNDLGIKVQITPDKIFTLYELYEVLEVMD